MKRILSLALVAMLTLAGCGGGGSSPPGTSTSAPASTGATASSVQLLVGSPQMSSAGTTPVTLTAVVLNSTGQVVPGRTVVFSKGTDSSAYISNVSAAGVSDANGLVTAQLNLGANKANRAITVSATVDGVSASNTVSVAGTTISFSGNNSMAFGATTTLTVTVKDSAGVSVPGVSVAVTSQNGNAIALTPATGVTDATGSVSAAVTATKAGNDVIAASGAGAGVTQSLTVSSASFGFTSPAASTQIAVNTATPISVSWTNAGAAVAGSSVTFTSSRGAITGSPALTSAAGVATANISSAAAGPAIITATGPGGTPSATLNVTFVANSASTVTAQATPSTIQPTTGVAGQTGNSATITAVVRDAALNLVQNARVNFAIVADTTGGTLSASTAVTDASGTASVTYTAGRVSSAQNGVTISATAVDIAGVAITPIASLPVSLTVGGTALFVRLGTDNTVAVSGVNNIKTYSALVTDAAGNAVPNAQVRFVVRPNRFMKGTMQWNGTLWTNALSTTATCGNEDVNFNGIVGPVSVIAAPNPTTGMPTPATVGGSAAGGIAIATNDYNGNGRVDPGNIASVNATATTDANGFALATIAYAKSYSYWAEVVLEARAGVVGNDPPADVAFILPGPSADYNSATVAPPGQLSAFGIAAGCNNAN